MRHEIISLKDLKGLYLLRCRFKKWRQNEWKNHVVYVYGPFDRVWAGKPPLRFSWIKEYMFIYLQTDYEMHWVLRIFYSIFWISIFNTCSYGELITGVSPTEIVRLWLRHFFFPGAPSTSRVVQVATGVGIIKTPFFFLGFKRGGGGIYRKMCQKGGGGHGPAVPPPPLNPPLLLVIKMDFFLIQYWNVYYFFLLQCIHNMAVTPARAIFTILKHLINYAFEVQ